MIYVLLPAYQEERGLSMLLPRLREVMGARDENWRIVVVDDGSRDRTSKIALSFKDRLDLHLIRFEMNRGVGEVFREGLRHICKNSRNPSTDICVTLDADNTQDPGKIPVMAEKIRSGDDIVIASRFRGEGRMVGCPWHRALLSAGVSWLLRGITRLPGVKDFSTFYRAYRVSVLIEGFERYGDRLLSGTGFAAIGALLLKLTNVTTRISEVPLVLRYDLKSGGSGNKILRSTRGYLELMRDYILTRGYRNIP